MTSAPAYGKSPTERLVSLDAFRGATMLFMVLVNNAGDGRSSYAPLKHADWNGWTPTDVVFPSFLWIVGVALSLSLARRIAQGISRAVLFRQAFRRATILYVLGLVVYAAPAFNPATQRFLGVLQRIAICYLAAVAIYLTSNLRGQILWIMGLLTTYWLLMTLVPVPGFGSGYLDVEGNFAHYIDRIVLGAHNYRSAGTWDPEGIVSTIPAVATSLLGIMAAHILRAKRTLPERTVWLFLVGNLLIAAGLICNTWLPINKKLWTPSFTLFMGGLDFVMFAMFLWGIDGVGYKRAAKPLAIVGMNAITIYMISELVDEALSIGHLHGPIYRILFASIASPANASLLYALAYTLLMYAVAYLMYRRKWFLRV